MKRITSYDLTFAIPHNPDADDAYVEQLLDDEQAREKERQERLIQEEEARKLRALARKRSALVKIVALIIVCIDLLRRLTEDLPPNPLIGPLRILAGWGIRLAKVANFAVAEPVHETYDSYFVDWPPEMSDFANRVKRSAEKMAAAVEALIEDLPEELLRNGGIPSIKSSPEPRREPSEPQSKEHTFTVTTRNQIQQALKDLRKELQKALNTKELPDCMPEEGSRLGDYEVLRSFEQEWRKNTLDLVVRTAKKEMEG